jgi:very-short-patch-repair endonuclease
LDLGSVVKADVFEIALDDALRRGMTSVSYLKRRLDDLAVENRLPRGMILDLLAVRGAGQRPAESPLETKTLQLLRRAGLPNPQRQYEMKDGDRFVARVDFAYPTWRIAIEVDGYAYHSSRSRWESALLRRNALEAAGWKVVHVTPEQIRTNPRQVIETIRGLISTQGKLIGS